jgi:tyrosine-protein kinase Etk/Wzc
VKETKEMSLSDYLEIIVKRRMFIIRNVIIVTVIAIVISLFLEVKYTATATVLPPNPNQDIMFGLLPTSIYSGATGFSSLAKLGGLVPGASTASDLFVEIMKSNAVKDEIIEKLDLKTKFKSKTMYHVRKILEEISDITISPEGIINVMVTNKDKYLATDIANSYVVELDKFNTETAMTVGKRYRIFIEKRLHENIDTLAQVEETLRKFQEEHRTIDLETEIISAIETIAQIKSQIILLEVKKGVLSSSSQFNNPYLYDVNKELKELKKQLSKIEFGGQDTTKKEFGAGFSVPFSELPEVAVGYARLLRDVKVQTAVFELLTQQYEQAKIMELKDTPTVQFLDQATPPERKSFPKRMLIVVFAFSLALFSSVFVSFFLEYLEEAKVKPQQHKMLITTINTVSQDFLKIKNYLKSKLKKK